MDALGPWLAAGGHRMAVVHLGLVHRLVELVGCGDVGVVGIRKSPVEVVDAHAEGEGAIGR